MKCVDFDDPAVVDNLRERADVKEEQRRKRLEKLRSRVDQPAIGAYPQMGRERP